MARPKLNPDEAREYSNSLAKAAAGDYELMDFAINTLRVPQALGMETSEWVDSIGGYVRMSVEDRRTAVRELQEGGKSQAQTAVILGISTATVKRDLAVTGLETQAQAQIGTGDRSQDPSTGPKPTVAEQRPHIREMIDAGKTDAEIAVYLGRGVATIQKERATYRKEQAPPATKALTKGEATALLEGRLAAIELAAINLAAWWLQQGKEALSDDPAWTDETIAHTRDKVSMILDSVRGVDSDADKALAKWAAEAEGSSG